MDPKILSMTQGTENPSRLSHDQRTKQFESQTYGQELHHLRQNVTELEQ